MEPFDHDLQPPPEPDPNDEGCLLQNCPRCAYSLRGLPLQHACPECGLAIDRRWVILGYSSELRRERQNWTVLALAISVSCVLVFCLLMARLNPKFLQLMVPVLLLGLIAVRAALKSCRGFIALGPEGLVLSFGTRKPTELVWSEIVKAGSHGMTGQLFIQRTDGSKVRIPLRYAITGPAFEQSIRRCVGLLEAYRIQYGAPAGATSP